MSMVEKVATAIYDVCSVEGVTPPWEELSKAQRNLHLEWGRAAIEALMEPTPDIEIAVDLHCNFNPQAGDGKRAWQAGIQAALKEGQ